MNPVYATYNKSYSRNNDCKSAVYVYTYINRERIIFSTGIFVTPNEWDEEKECVMGCVLAAKDYNLIINNFKARITQIFVTYRLRFETLTPERLKYEFKLSESIEYFYDYALFKLNKRKYTIADTTYIKHLTHINKVREFEPKLRLRDFTKDFLESYIAWCRKVKKNKQTSIKTGTTCIKVYISMAVKEKLLNENPFSEVKIATGNFMRVFLTETELKELHKKYNEKTLTDSRQEVLKAFLLACYTGLRISDIKQLTYGNIMRDEILLTMQKTRNSSGRIVRIPLNEPAHKLIFEKQAYSQQQPVFNLMSEQKMRVFLKKLCASLGIDKNVVFHSSRHTFATIFLRHTNNLLGLKELLGHSKIEQTLIYAHLIRSDLENDMKCFDSF